MLLALGIAGGLLPDPAALALLLGALSSGKVLLGLVTVVVFSLGFAATLVAVGIVAAKVGEKVLDWLASIWMIRLQIATSLLIVGMGVVLTIRAASELAAPRQPEGPQPYTDWRHEPLNYPVISFTTRTCTSVSR